jgi:hypothetical protein
VVQGNPSRRTVDRVALEMFQLENEFPTNFVVAKPEAIPEWKPPEKLCPDLRIITEQEFSLGDYRPGRFAWTLANA